METNNTCVLGQQPPTQALSNDTTPISRPDPSSDVTKRPRTTQRSCALCHRRKIRCDRQSPCSPCARTGVLCCYPTNDTVARRPRTTSLANVSARLSRLERTLAAYSTVGDSNLNSLQPPEDMPAHYNNNSAIAHEVSSAGSSLEEVLVLDDTSSHYFNEALFSRVLEEEKEIQSILRTSAEESSDCAISADKMPFKLVGILSEPQTGYQPFLPAKRQAMQLWQAFINNVDPVIRVLHLPTAQIAVFAAIEDLNTAPADVGVLLFSIYFAACISLEANTVEDITGHNKTAALELFKKGLEQSLVCADFLESPSITALQGLAIYMTAVRAHHPGRSVWVLGGLITRLAQSIGLHRDGERLNLSPFESEIRRRLWWHFVEKEGRAAEDYGITISYLDITSNINLPRNLDDGELYPDMTELPPSHSRWTTMSLPLVSMEVGRTIELLHRMIRSPVNQLPDESVRRDIVSKLADRMEGYLQQSNTIIPLHRLSVLVSKLTLGKLDIISHLQWQSRASNGKRNVQAQEGDLVKACDCLELAAQISSDESLQQYRWFMSSYSQYHMLLYVLWHLCVKPTGPSVDHAWRVVDRSFELESMSARHENVASYKGSKWTVLRSLRLKALRIRESASPGGHTNGQVRGVASDYGSRSVVEQSGDGFSNEVSHWETELGDLPDWDALANDFNLQECDVLAAL